MNRIAPGPALLDEPCQLGQPGLAKSRGEVGNGEIRPPRTVAPGSDQPRRQLHRVRRCDRARPAIEAR